MATSASSAGMRRGHKIGTCSCTTNTDKLCQASRKSYLCKWVQTVWDVHGPVNTSNNQQRCRNTPWLPLPTADTYSSPQLSVS